MRNLEKILSLAREQIGVTEQPPGSNNVIYNTDYYGGPVQGSGYPWCCSFIWWLFWKSGLSALFCGGQKTAYCPFVVNYAQDNGKWVTEAYQPGDLLLYDWDGDGVADHIGLCESDTDFAGYMWAIEGNVGDAVQRTRRWTGSILGAYRPEYGDGMAEDGGTTGAASSAGLTEKSADTYTVQPGDSLWAIARKAGTSVEALARINAIPDPDRIWPGQVLKLREEDGEETVWVRLCLPRRIWDRYGSAEKLREALGC